MDPITLLSKLKPKLATKFILKEITIDETKEIIQNMTNINIIWFGRVTSRIVKLSTDISSITHTIKVSIREEKSLSAMKIARVIPILKPNNLKTSPSVYSPISNLHTLEKVYKEHIKQQLSHYMITNQIIHKNHQ